MPHQRAILEAYVEQAIDQPDVALQLPTGSGKTLVGLLIGEWRRRKYNEKVVYLCPTRQLVHQTASQADKNYGLDVLSFAGSAGDYLPADVAKYKSGQGIAVTTYNSLFNINPFFSDPDTVIVDDAHAAENYIASMWTLEIRPSEDAHKALHAAVCGVLKPHLSNIDYSRLVGLGDSSADASWVDKIPTPILCEIRDDLVEILEAHIGNSSLKYAWSKLKDHVDSCHLYVSANSILLRPLVPPTWAHPAFEKAKHRIFMSATLGEGGDLERLTGRQNITRLPVPKGFEVQGVGRRFFMFPGMSLDLQKSEDLRIQLMKVAGRSVVLAPSQAACDAIAEKVQKDLRYKIFSAEDIERSKAKFIGSDRAVAILAGRYDGIDFPRDECRLLSVDGLPRAMNAQERFMMSKMGAAVLFNERIQTRVLQAIGRCTRALQDYSAVYVTGVELQDYLADMKRQKFFHPELQAELAFGVEQSIDVDEKNFSENFRIFLANEREWAEANDQIVANTKEMERESFPAMDELSEAVKFEIRYQKAMWQSDYVAAFGEAKNVLGYLKAPELRGYRALWYYLSGSAAYLASEAGHAQLMVSAREQFGQAKKATNALPWLVKLARFSADDSVANLQDQDSVEQVEQLENFLCSIGILHEGNFATLEKKILEGLENPKEFEQAHRLIGEVLGFQSKKVESSGSPDPWWISKTTCLVFEDHADALPTSELNVTKARQVAGHPAWIKANSPETAELQIIPILISPVLKANEGAIPHLQEVRLWPLSDFRKWVKKALNVIRELRHTLNEPGDIVWRAEASQRLDAEGLTMTKIVATLNASPAIDFFS